MPNATPTRSVPHWGAIREPGDAALRRARPGSTRALATRPTPAARRAVAAALVLGPLHCSPSYRAPVPAPQQMYASGDVEQPPEIVLTPPLVYPPDPRLIGLDGVVLVHAVVDAAGNVEPTTTQVLETPDSALGAAAVALVRRTLFRPARVRGRTVQAGLELAVAFAHAASPPVSVHFLGDVYRAGEVDEPPRVTSAPALVYPAPLLLAGIHGRVVVRAVLDTLGRVEDTSVAVVETADPRFNEPAKDYVRRSRFAPGRIAGRAVRVRVELPVEFRLPSRD